MQQKSKEEILDKIFIEPETQDWYKPVLSAMEEYGEEKSNEANEFIGDIAKLLGEDGLGFDDLTWTIDDFKNAINEYRSQPTSEEYKLETGDGYGTTYAASQPPHGTASGGYSLEQVREPDEAEAWKEWEQDQMTNPNPVNPHAFVYGYNIAKKKYNK